MYYLFITLIYWLLAFNKLHSVGVNISLARSKNIKSNLLEDSFSILIAIIVMLSIKWVGILIINALLILPAATSRNIASNVREYHLFSILVAIFSGVIGLVLSFYLGTATGPTVVIIAAILFLLPYLLAPLKANSIYMVFYVYTIEMYKYICYHIYRADYISLQ